MMGIHKASLVSEPSQRRPSKQQQHRSSLPLAPCGDWLPWTERLGTRFLSPCSAQTRFGWYLHHLTEGGFPCNPNRKNTTSFKPANLHKAHPRCHTNECHTNKLKKIGEHKGTQNDRTLQQKYPKVRPKFKSKRATFRLNAFNYMPNRSNRCFV